MEENNGWIGVDLDGTLAEYTEWIGPSHIGKPIYPMLHRVIKWIEEGKNVKIFTARACPTSHGYHIISIDAIKSWLRRHIGRELEITYMKDYNMIELWDDRAIQVIPNTGHRVDGKK